VSSCPTFPMYASTAWLYSSSVTARFSRGDGKKRTLAAVGTTTDEVGARSGRRALAAALVHRRAAAKRALTPAAPMRSADGHSIRSARLTMIPWGPRTEAMRQTCSYSPTPPITL
jgi:hypothetical protein